MLRGVALEAVDAETLRQCGARLRIVGRGSGRYDIHTRQMVGAVRTRSIDLVLRPKIDLAGFLEMLADALGLVRFGADVTLVGGESILSVMAALYARAIARALSRGLLRGYDMRSEPLSHVRGRVDSMALAVRRFGVIPPIDCTYQEFTADIEVNQRLRAAALFLLRSGACDAPTEALLRSSISRLSPVSDRRFVRPVRPLPRERRFATYGAAVDLADLVLNATSLDLRNGAVRSLGFLVDMDDVYEAWVAARVGRFLRVPAARWRRHPGALFFDREQRVKLEPDVVWTRRGAPKLPIDAKYKRGERIPNADVYQLAAYCAALGSKEGVLFCADVPSHTLWLVHGVRVHVHRLPVEGGAEARSRAVAEAARLLSSLEPTSAGAAAGGGAVPTL